MKLSVSVPDDLWGSLAADGDSPSEVVQEALRLMAQHRHPAEPFANAPSRAVLEQAKVHIDLAVSRLVSEREDWRAAGYAAGMEVCAGDSVDLDWFRISPTNLEDMVDMLSDAMHSPDGGIYHQIYACAERDDALESIGTGNDPFQPFPDYIRGVAAALLDVWHEVDRRLETR